VSYGEAECGRNKSRSTVANSALVLRRPTSPPTAGRKPEASPPSPSAVGVGVDLGVGVGVDVGGSQLKSWDSSPINSDKVIPAHLSPSPNDSDISALRDFFTLLDRWDRRTLA